MKTALCVRPFGLLENGLSLKGSFVFAGRDKQQAGPRRAAPVRGPVRRRLVTGQERGSWKEAASWRERGRERGSQMALSVVAIS